MWQEKEMEERYSSVWFTEMGSSRPIGIVIAYSSTGNKAYIGTGEGLNREEDEKRIAKRGAKFPLSEALRLMDWW